LRQPFLREKIKILGKKSKNQKIYAFEKRLDLPIFGNAILGISAYSGVFTSKPLHIVFLTMKKAFSKKDFLVSIVVSTDNKVFFLIYNF